MPRELAGGGGVGAGAVLKLGAVASQADLHLQIDFSRRIGTWEP